MVFIICQTDGDLTNKYEIANYIKTLIKSNKKINRIKTSDYKSIAKRQLNSNLNCNKLDKLCIIIRNNWKTDVKKYIDQLKKQNDKKLSVLNKIRNKLKEIFICLNKI